MSSSGHLQRGQACFYCRQRKMKCDGARPICGNCERTNRAEDCEYTNGQKRARAEMLQESISRVEKRIYELEHPEAPKFDVALHQPYQPGRSRTSGPVQQSWATAEEPPMDMVEKLIDTFLSCSSEVGFFLNAARFRQSALMRHPIGHPARPTPAVLVCVYLWGLRFSKQPNLIAQEPAFLSRALNLTAKSLSGIHPQKVMHTLQAEILLAYYFFASGRFLEGKYHTAAAVSLALSSGLHMVRSTKGAPPTSLLPAARDAVEEGERIHAWWTVVVLDKAWAVAFNEDPHLQLQHQSSSVDTPWPLEMEDYQNGRLSPAARYSNTYNKFITSTPTSDTGTSTIAVFTKATILWQGAERLVRQWKPDMPRDQASSFHSSFSALDTHIEKFRASLVPPNQIRHPTPAMVRTLVVGHSVAYAATLQLYTLPPLRGDANAGRKRLAAARAVLEIIVSVPLQSFGFINPIIGTVWLAACQVLMDEIYKLRMQHTSWQPSGEEQGFISLLMRTISAISIFSGTCPLLTYQITRLQEAATGMQ
ncbi:Zn(2)-C6 fungal-type domain-containing protein [Favolaschia claudopus]|uniref:Zn(2)-C6 fungal-type domain-containing protein n=1 Tax=Favolaschia claudopus TaxID=2862362 RepID=A0AAW0CCM0_9AGAR